tara:strand:- start:10031 stop:10426 length:396 start_codon:yes stop_codon:yes gene_type:complete
VVDEIDGELIFETKRVFLVFRTIEEELRLVGTSQITETFPTNPALWGQQSWDWKLVPLELVANLIQVLQEDLEAGNSTPSIRENDGDYAIELVLKAVWNFCKQDLAFIEESGQSTHYDFQVVEVNVEMKIK